MNDKFAEKTQASYEKIAIAYSKKHQSLSKPFELMSAYMCADYGAVLDVGCGTGRDSCALAQLGNPVLGVDASASMIRKAREHNKDSLVKYVNANVSEFESHHRFGIIWANAVLHHLSPEVLKTTVAKLAGMLNQPGRLLLTSRLDIANRYDDEYLGAPRYYYGHTEAEYSKLIGDNALHIIARQVVNSGNKVWLLIAAERS